ncbi:MAG: multidrug transporter AcrB, partial [Desulfobacteraceae bacterium IS3]
MTKIIEDSISGLEGIRTISSKSRQEKSEISIKFNMERDADNAAADVRDRVGRVRGALPDDVDEPVIAKVEANSTPIIFMSFYSDRHSPGEITDYLDRVIKDRFETISGVSQALILAGSTYSMRIWLDPVKLAARSLTVQDVENALRQQNIEVPGGRIESTAREFTILTDTGMNTVEEFENLILKNETGYLVRVRDVGRVEIGPENERQRLRSNGKTAVGIGIVKQSTANPLEISTAIRKILPEMKAGLPAGMSMDLNYDSSVFIQSSIDNVFKTIFEAVGMVVLVIFFFLR